MLLNALLDFPRESQLFETLVEGHLEPTVHDGIANLPFFKEADMRCTTMLAVYARRWVAMPGIFLVYEGTSGDSLFIVNRGLVALIMKDVEACSRVVAGCPLGHFQPAAHSQGLVVSRSAALPSRGSTPSTLGRS